MRVTRLLALAVVVVMSALQGTAQRGQQEPSIRYGLSTISLGMTLAQTQQSLSSSGRHLEQLQGDPDKATWIVSTNARKNDEGQVTIRNGKVVYADYTMPDARDADELGQEIAGAIESMSTKTCQAQNYSSRGTGGNFSQSIFSCGLQRFDIQTAQVIGSPRQVNVNIRIGSVTQ
jgi:hypothetical protein